MSTGGPTDPYRDREVATPAAASADVSAMEETAATHEDRRVMAFASELRISSAISPRELLSLRITSPLESNDELESEGGGKEEETTSSRGGNVSGSGGLLGRCAFRGWHCYMCLCLCCVLYFQNDLEMARRIFVS